MFEGKDQFRPATGETPSRLGGSDVLAYLDKLSRFKRERLIKVLNRRKRIVEMMQEITPLHDTCSDCRNPTVWSPERLP